MGQNFGAVARRVTMSSIALSMDFCIIINIAACLFLFLQFGRSFLFRFPLPGYGRLSILPRIAFRFFFRNVGESTDSSEQL